MVFAILLAWDILRDPGTFYGLSLLLGGALEPVALGCGLGSRRTAAGKTGLFISLASLLLLVLAMSFTASSVRNVRIEPVPQPAAPAAQP